MAKTGDAQTKAQENAPLVVEVAWEVCNQVGGIYTVIRSKAPTAVEAFGDNYCLVGPSVHPNVSAEFDPVTDEDDPFYQAVKKMQEGGIDAIYGRWLVTGRPRTVLVNPYQVFDYLGDVKYKLWEHHGISLPADDALINDVVAFGHLVQVFLHELALAQSQQRDIVAHFHEWMAGTAIPELRRQHVPVSIVFTTHATLLGRYLAMNSPNFYDHLNFMDWEAEAKHFNIEPAVRIERAAAHGSQVFTTVSEVTAKECVHLLGRNPDLILPNGINIERFEALHEVQNLHQQYKEKIHEFVQGHFFHNYTFNLDRVLYMFTSGRYEYRNKGYDLTLEALARLNHRLKESGSDRTVVMFFITKRPVHSINPEVLQSRAVMRELRETCDAIQKQIGDNLFHAAPGLDDNKLPSLNEFVDDYWRLRFRRTLQSWKSNSLPRIVTHNLVDDSGDDVLNFLRTSNLLNHEHDRVKVVYHPDFLNTSNPLLPLDYSDFVRGCHLGIFPSYYEPWGYTPLECIASGVQTVTSDLSGFGDYLIKQKPDYEDSGIYVINRDRRSFEDSAQELADKLYDFAMLSRRERIGLRAEAENASTDFSWANLNRFYEESYELALSRIK